MFFYTKKKKNTKLKWNTGIFKRTSQNASFTHNVANLVAKMKISELKKKDEENLRVLAYTSCSRFRCSTGNDNAASWNGIVSSYFIFFTFSSFSFMNNNMDDKTSMEQWYYTSISNKIQSDIKKCEQQKAILYSSFLSLSPLVVLHFSSMTKCTRLEYEYEKCLIKNCFQTFQIVILLPVRLCQYFSNTLILFRQCRSIGIRASNPFS